MFSIKEYYGLLYVIVQETRIPSAVQISAGPHFGQWTHPTAGWPSSSAWRMRIGSEPRRCPEIWGHRSRIWAASRASSPAGSWWWSYPRISPGGRPASRSCRPPTVCTASAWGRFSTRWQSCRGSGRRCWVGWASHYSCSGLWSVFLFFFSLSWQAVRACVFQGILHSA